ncbi:MAG: tetratricopeptide repeat protein [Myxococcales bacterium]
MRIQCPNCPAAYELDDGRVPPAGLSIKCPKCKTPFTVHRAKPGEGKPAGQKVPLPGTGAPPARPPPGTKSPGSRVPLPGTQSAGSPSAPSRAVPLPGHGDPLATPPPRPNGDPFARAGMPAVPLPGLDDEMSAGGAMDASPATKQADLDAAFAPAPPAEQGSLDDAFPVPDETALTPKKALGETDLAPKQSAGYGESQIPSPLGDEGAPSFDFVDPGSAKPPPAAPPPPDAPEMLDFAGEQPRPSPTTGRAPPPMIAPASARPDKGREKKRPAFRGQPSLFRARNLVVVLLLAAAGGVAALGVRARNTPAGLFWRNNLVAVSRGKPSAATLAVVAAGEARLAQGTFSSAREALGAAAQLLGSAPNDDDAKAFFVLCAAELKVWYGQGGGDWDQAKRVLDRMKGNAAPQNRARGAFALAVGDVGKARQLLSTLAEADLESAWLFSQALIRTNDVQRAAQVLDRALKGQHADSPKLLIARGIAAKALGALPEASGFFEKALAAQPDHGRALVELADVKLLQNDTEKAARLLDKALAQDARKTLDASEEARGATLRGKLLIAQHHGKEAEAAFERAVQLDPNSGEAHAAYGAFRLHRREYEKAQKQLESAVGLDPGNARVLADLARAYLGTNRLLEADKRVQEAVARDANDPQVLFVQGRVAEAIGKQEDAYKAYDKALQKKPDLAEALVAQGSIWFSRGDKQKAREKLDAVLKTPSRTAREEEAAADLALDLGDGKKGKECYERALQLDPEDAQAHSGLGRALAALGDLPGARAELESALRQVDTDAVLHFEYGSLLRRIGDAQGALSALQRAVQLDSKDPRFRSRLGALLVERKEYEKAETELRQARLGNDRYGETWFNLARALAGQGRLGEAMDTIRRAVEIEPENPEYLYFLGLVYEQGQQVQDAVESFQKSIAKNPKNADAYEHLGQNLNVQNRFLEAVSAFKKAAELDRSRARLWAQIADSQQQAGDLDGAIGSYQKSLAQDPNQPGVWSRLGIAYKDRGCTGCKNRAIEALKHAEVVDPKDWVAHHELGYLYKDDGRRAEAIAQFRKYLNLRPDAGDVDTVKDDIYYLQEESRRTP